MFRIKAVRSAVVIVAVTACAHAAMQSPNTDVASYGTGTATVTGRVTTRDGRPIANARVYVPGTGAATRTDANGNYALADVPAGPQAVVVRQRGYVPVRVDAKFSTKPSDRDRNRIDVTLETPSDFVAVANQTTRDAAGLEKVGFLQRESTVRGAYFITPEQIS